MMMAPANTALAQQDNSIAGKCELELIGDTSIDWRGVYGRGYEVTEHQQDFETLGVTVRHEGDACDYFIVATPNSASKENTLLGAGDALYWDLLATTNGPSLVSEDFFGSLDTQFRGRFGQGLNAQPIMFYFTIPPSQFVRGGFYDGQLLLKLFRDNSGAPELLDELPVALAASVPSILQVRSDEFGGGVRETTMDLGDLTVASNRLINFDIISNAAVGIGLESMNRGVLAHEFKGPGVPYDLLLNGSLVSLDGSAMERIGMTAPDGRNYAEIEIALKQSYSALAAGRYSDRLTITFKADP